MSSLPQEASPARADSAAITHNAEPLAFGDVPRLAPEDFHSTCLRRLAAGQRISALFALPGGAPELVAVLSDDRRGELALLRGEVRGGVFPSLTAQAPQAQAFEREIFELHGLEPEGHPWLKPLRRHLDLEKDAANPPPAHPFFQVEGPAIHEVAVGPVHAGIIEPGHFRFQCHGEDVFSLEIHLGYQHRGAEKLLLGAPAARRLAIAETLAGDTTVGHASAHCLALEALAGVEVPQQAQALRAVGLELERLANHVGDLGALCGDVGYLPGLSYFGRLRGEFLNLSLELCGNRFGRGLLRLGGVRFDLAASRIRGFLDRLEKAEQEVNETAEMAFDTPSVVSRFERTGTLTREQADELGLVGPAARACGCDRDTRCDHRLPFYKIAPITMARAETGDVMARGLMRWREAKHSMEYVKLRVAELAGGPVADPMKPMRPDSIVVAMTEGWRGEIVHVALTGSDGALRAYKVVDPSFHNWFGLAMALRGNEISDFPLCNKSFNLSYAGHDL